MARSSKKNETSEKLSKRKKRAFLNALAKTGRVAHAARAAGYTDSRYLQKLRREDEDFAQEWDEAVEAAGDVLEDAAMQRAVEGVKEDVFYKGAVVGQRIIYSDALLQFLLKHNKPDKYRENQNNGGAGAFNFAVLPVPLASAEDWEKVAGKVLEGQSMPISQNVVSTKEDDDSRQLVRR